MKNESLRQNQNVPRENLLFVKTVLFIGKLFLILPVLVYGCENSTAITENLQLHFQ